MRYKISELCDINSENLSSKDCYEFINYLDTSNLTENNIEDIKKLIAGKDKIPSRAKRKVKKGDILISTVRPNQKHYGFIKNDDIDNLIVSTGFSVLRCNNKVNYKYLYYYLTLPQITEYLQGIAETSTTAYPSLKPSVIGDLEIDLPLLEEQERIANILSSLDDKIELNNEMNKTLEEMAQSIFKRWFVDFEFPNEDGEPYKSSGGEMVESELGMIPKGWEVKELGELVNLTTKSEKPYNNKEVLYEHFSIPALDNNKLPVFEFGKSISSNKYLIDNDCILMSKLNPDNKRIWNPNCMTDKSICSTEFMVYKPIDKNNKSFIYEILNNEKFTEFLISNATGSTGSRQRVKPKDTLEYIIAIPNEENIKNIVKILNPIHTRIQLNIQNTKELMNLRDALLPKVMSGEIEVN